MHLIQAVTQLRRSDSCSGFGPHTVLHADACSCEVGNVCLYRCGEQHVDNCVKMAWRQELELELLAQLSTATCTQHFVIRETRIKALSRKVEAELSEKDGLKRLLSDGVFLQELFSAASAGLMAVCNALKGGALLTPADSSCMTSFFEIIGSKLLKDAMFTLSMPHAAVVLGKGAVPMPPKALQISRMLSFAQSIITQTGMYTAGMRPVKRPGGMT